MKRFAISDIHGCAATFKALLEKINFSKGDELYLLGDYIDRGPDSKGVIDHIWLLQGEGYMVKCLRGNHEELMLGALHNTDVEATWLGNGGWKTMESFGVLDADKIPQQYYHWIKDLDYYFEVDDYILVHAGLNFQTEEPLKDFRNMLWIRNWTGDIDRKWLDGRVVVYGHTPTHEKDIRHYAKHMDKTPAIVIDNGCVYKGLGKGNLVAFDLDTHILHFQPCIDY